MDINKGSIFLCPVVKAIFYMKDELLHYKDYDNLIPAGYRLLSTAHCEVKNVVHDYVIMNNKVILSIEFDLVAIYEYQGMDGGGKEYGLLKDRVKWTKDMDIKSYDMFTENTEVDNMKCRHIIRQIWCLADIHQFSSGIAIGVHSSIDSILYEEDMIKLGDVPVCAVNQTQDTAISYRLPEVAPIADDDDSLDAYVTQLGNLVKKSAEISGKNIELQRDLEDKSKRLNYAEYRLGQLEEEYDELKEQLKSKNSTIDELSNKLDKAEKKAALLQNANVAMDEETRALTKENGELKAYIDEEEAKKRKRLDYRIKSAINNMKIF